MLYFFRMKKYIKDSLTQEESVSYVNLITSLVNTAIIQTEGLANELNVGKKKKKKSPFSLDSRNVHVYIEGNTVTVDIYVNVIFGFSIPVVACELQEKVIAAIKENTPLIPGAINVNVSNSIFL